MTRTQASFGTLLAAFAVSCGSSEKHDGASGSEPDVAECPDIAPSFQAYCPENLGPESCSYTLDCASGQREFTFTCPAPYSHWYVEESPCEREAEFCTGGEQQIRCGETSEGGLMWGADYTAFDGPGPCPTETQHHGEPCMGSTFSPGHCGYFCDDGTTWTVGICPWNETNPTWEFDGACEQ
jgi:hypothetical protein